MIQGGKIYVGKGTAPVYLLPQIANRHGLIAGKSSPVAGKYAQLAIIPNTSCSSTRTIKTIRKSQKGGERR